MGSLEKRLEALEGRIKALPGESRWRAARQEYATMHERALAANGRTLEQQQRRAAELEKQGYSSQDARIIAYDEVIRIADPELAEFTDASFPPQIRHDPLAKMDWLEKHLELLQAEAKLR